MNYGTIFECDGKKAVRHRVPQCETVTVCGRQALIPENWNKIIGWSIYHAMTKEVRCKKCYPKFKTKRSKP